MEVALGQEMLDQERDAQGPRPGGGTDHVDGDTESENDAAELDLDMFDTARPKHLLSGVWSGAKSIVKGAASGAFFLFALPIEGAREGGAMGALALTTPPCAIYTQESHAASMAKIPVCMPVANVAYHGSEVWIQTRESWEGS